jgi:hypothetical protein
MNNGITRTAINNRTATPTRMLIKGYFFKRYLQ